MMVFFIILLSFLLSHIFEKIKLPKVLAPIFVGFCFSFRKDLFSDYLYVIELLSNLGIILLLFYIGLEIDIKGVKKQKKETLLIAFLAFFMSFFFGFVYSFYYLSYSLIVSFVIASTLSITAEGIMTVLLEEKRLSKSKTGEVIIAAGMIDDMMGILLLVIISFIISINTFSFLAFQPILLGVIAILIAHIFFKNVVNFLGKIFMSHEKDNYYNVFTLALIFVLGLASFSNYIGLDFSVGAIVAGIMINISLSRQGKKGIRDEYMINKFIKSISFGFLSYIFFFWIGYNMSIELILKNPLLGISLALIGFSSKMFASLLGSYIVHDKFKNGFLIGLGMSTKGAIEMIIAEVARSSGLISNDIFSAIVLMGIILTVFPAIAFDRMC